MQWYYWWSKYLILTLITSHRFPPGQCCSMISFIIKLMVTWLVFFIASIRVFWVVSHSLYTSSFPASPAIVLMKTFTWHSWRNLLQHSWVNHDYKIKGYSHVKESIISTFHIATSCMYIWLVSIAKSIIYSWLLQQLWRVVQNKFYNNY